MKPDWRNLAGNILVIHQSNNAHFPAVTQCFQCRLSQYVWKDARVRVGSTLQLEAVTCPPITFSLRSTSNQSGLYCGLGPLNWGSELQALLGNLSDARINLPTDSWSICLQVLLHLHRGKVRMAFCSHAGPIFTIRCQLYYLNFWFLRHESLPGTGNREYKHTRLLSENTVSNCLLFKSYQKPSWEKQYLQEIIWRICSPSILQNTLNSIHEADPTTSQLPSRAILLQPHTELPPLNCIFNVMPFAHMKKSYYGKQSYESCYCTGGKRWNTAHCMRMWSWKVALEEALILEEDGLLFSVILWWLWPWLPGISASDRKLSCGNYTYICVFLFLVTIFLPMFTATYLMYAFNKPSWNFYGSR